MAEGPTGPSGCGCGCCCPALPQAGRSRWHRPQPWTAAAVPRSPWHHCADLSSHSFLFLEGLCPGTFLLFSLCFACKGLLKSWMSCLHPSPDPLRSHLAESFTPASSDGGRSVGVGWGWGCRLTSHRQEVWH